MLKLQNISWVKFQPDPNQLLIVDRAQVLQGQLHTQLPIIRESQTGLCWMGP